MSKFNEYLEVVSSKITYYGEAIETSKSKIKELSSLIKLHNEVWQYVEDNYEAICRRNKKIIKVVKQKTEKLFEEVVKNREIILKKLKCEGRYKNQIDGHLKWADEDLRTMDPDFSTDLNMSIANLHEVIKIFLKLESLRKPWKDDLFVKRTKSK